MTNTEQLQEDLEALEERVSRLESLLEESPDVADGVVDMQTFVREFDPDTHTERTLAMGYFLEEREGQDGFTRADITDAYKQCRMSSPANISDVFAGCEERGWLLRDGQDGQAQVRKLTIDGLEYVEEVLADGD